MGGLLNNLSNPGAKQHREAALGAKLDHEAAEAAAGGAQRTDADQQQQGGNT